MKRNNTLSFLMLFILCTKIIGQQISNVNYSSNSLLIYDKFEINFAVALENENPYNPDDIDCYAEFISPTGKTFFNQHFITKVLMIFMLLATVLLSFPFPFSSLGKSI